MHLIPFWKLRDFCGSELANALCPISIINVVLAWLWSLSSADCYVWSGWSHQTGQQQTNKGCFCQAQRWEKFWLWLEKSQIHGNVVFLIGEQFIFGKLCSMKVVRKTICHVNKAREKAQVWMLGAETIPGRIIHRELRKFGVNGPLWVALTSTEWFGLGGF